MAKATKITRTITTTKADILCVNAETEEMYVETVSLPRTFKNDAEILKAAKKKLETDTVKPIAVKGAVIDSKLYAIDEETFIANAKIIEK